MVGHSGKWWHFNNYLSLLGDTRLNISLHNYTNYIIHSIELNIACDLSCSELYNDILHDIFGPSLNRVQVLRGQKGKKK